MNLIKTLCATSALTFLAACGGGGGSDGGSIGIPPAPVPPVTMTITHKVTMTTSKGVIELGLDAKNAPLTVANFLKYVNDGFYKNTVFHRVESNFVVQGGGVVRSNGSLVEKPPTYSPIALESNNGLSNLNGTIAMARTVVANSATSQFYFNVKDNTELNYPGPDKVGGYAVFGKITAGLDVLNAIRTVPVNGTVPVQDVLITEVKEVK